MPLFNIAGKYSNALGSAFQGARDFVVDRVAPRPEALFIKAMTGGAPTQTTMTPTELGKIKDAFIKQKSFPLKSDEQVFEDLITKYEQHKAEHPKLFEGPMPIAIKPTMKMAQQINANAKADQQNPVTSLYNYGRDMSMAYGNLSVFPQPDGGVRIYDRWKVDKNLGGIQDTNTRVGDLQEGGPLPSLIYNKANQLGWYKPFDIDVTIPGDEWKQIERIGEPQKPKVGTTAGIVTSADIKKALENEKLTQQGFALNAINSQIQRTQPGPFMSPNQIIFPAKPQ